jgi:hypothetical protein
MQIKKNSSLMSSLLSGGVLLIAAGAAQAGDLPSGKAAAVNYVKICDAYGSGFFVLPGTDTCARFTENIQAIYEFAPAQNTLVVAQSHKGGFNAGAAWTQPTVSYDPTSAGSKSGTLAQNAATMDTSGYQTDLRFGMDSRTPTAFGTLRTVVSLRAKYNAGILAGSGTSVSPLGSGGTETKMALDRAYVQYLGFTAGYITDPFAFYYEDQVATALSDPKGTLAALNYTALLGNGFSLLAGIDNPAFHIDKGAAANGSCCSGLDTNVNHLGVNTAIGPYTWPDIDLVARVDQRWGSAQVSALIHPISQIVMPGTGPTGVLFTNGVQGATGPVSAVLRDWGFALLAGVKFNVPMIGPGDQLWLQGIYSNGALEAAGIGGSQGNLGIADTTRLLGGLNRQDMDAIAVARNNGSFFLEKEQVWNSLFAFQHYWVADKLRSNLLMSYTVVNPGSQTRTTDWLKGGLSSATMFKIGANLIWSPVQGMDIVGEIMNTSVRQKLASDPGVAASCTPGTPYQAPGSATCGILNGIKISPSNWQAILNVTRRF